MPQLIAMVIVVVGAMIYMFQTFGGTGDKIEGIAQKTSIITEINNIRNGLQLAVRAGDINRTSATEGTTLVDLAKLGYFADQMNNEISDNTGGAINTAAGYANEGINTYSAISFGGETNPGMLLSLITSSTAPTEGDATANPVVKGTITQRPGIKVQLTGVLSGNAGFLESQIATDLAAVASIDRTTTTNVAVTLDEQGNVPAVNNPATGDALTDGVFTIYFRDMPAGVVQ